MIMKNHFMVRLEQYGMEIVQPYQVKELGLLVIYYQLAFDCDNDKIWWGVNNSYINSGNPSTGTNGIAFNHPPTQDSNMWGFNNYIAFMGYGLQQS